MMVLTGTTPARVLLSALVILAAVFWACGGTSSESGTQAPASDEPVTSLPEEALPPTPDGSPPPEPAEPIPHPPGIDRIAYADLDRQIWTAKPDGSDKIRVTFEEGRYTWPTWSPDGRKLVYSGVLQGDEGEQEVSLYSFNTATGRTQQLYTNEPGVTGLVTRDVPHYGLWSPDGNHFAFVAVSADGLRLYIDDIEDDADPVPVVASAPLHFSWSASARYLLVHRGPDHFLVDTDGGVQWSEMDISSVATHNVPAWWPGGDRMTVVARGIGAGEYGIYLMDIDGDDTTFIDRFSVASSYSWSPNGELLAVGHVRAPGLPMQLRLFSPDGTRHAIRIDDNLIAYFWSPDGAKLAYVTLTERPGVFSWNVLNVDDGVNWPLVDFIPSRDQAVWLQFFDQYWYSHSLWSPDGTSLVFAGQLYTGAVTASAGRQQNDQIIVMDVSRNPSTHVISDGFLGFWSPQ